MKYAWKCQTVAILMVALFCPLRVLSAEKVVIDHAIVMEDIANGERVREYRIEGLVGADTWRSLCTGQSVGHKRIEQFDPVEVAKVRLRTLRATAKPLIRTLAVYHVG